jgi:hypothetical protein
MKIRVAGTPRTSRRARRSQNLSLQIPPPLSFSSPISSPQSPLSSSSVDTSEGSSKGTEEKKRSWKGHIARLAMRKKLDAIIAEQEAKNGTPPDGET